jgi:hypothetical protein
MLGEQLPRFPNAGSWRPRAEELDRGWSRNESLNCVETRHTTLGLGPDTTTTISGSLPARRLTLDGRRSPPPPTAQARLAGSWLYCILYTDSSRSGYSPSRRNACEGRKGEEAIIHEPGLVGNGAQETPAWQAWLTGKR